MVTTESLERVAGLVDDARSQGAEVVVGGEAEGPCYMPTVLAGVTPEMRIYHEESFGPVVGIVEVDGADEAVRVANDTEYGLAAAVFGEDVPTALDLARQIESGICHVNGSTLHDEPQMPFGGVKASGFGRFGGKAAIDEFTELRWITVQHGSRHYPIYRRATVERGTVEVAPRLSQRTVAVPARASTASTLPISPVAFLRT
jgi:benzaldehyde dehydrogenase (NAD)